MDKIIECVPNFSEGQDADVIKAISEAIQNTAGCILLNCDPGSSTNRTVYTFVGDCQSVVQGALAAAKVAFERIDMTKHTGEHPRMGALDVCPFIPVKNATMDECVDCSKEFAKLLSDDLTVPVYLYGFAATEEKRVSLPSIRSGEYEKLPQKLSDPEWRPDYGPAEFVPRWGATVTGARKFLIAYNVNVLSTKEQAHRIALDLRESGRGKQSPGKLKDVQGIGWFLDEQNLAQVSTNITDFNVTPIHVLYEAAKLLAMELKIPVTGSEIVGLVPLESILQAANFYIEAEELFIIDERSKVRLAIDRLGLNSLYPFDPEKRIIEYCVADEKRDCPLGSMSVKGFVNAVGSRTPAPGGGSVSALVASMGAALATMAGLLTYGKRQWEDLDSVMRANILPVHDAMKELIPLIDRDTKAFDSYMHALKMPRKTEEEKGLRTTAMQEGIVHAIQAPLAVMESINKCWPYLLEIARHCNISCASDIQVGVKCLETGSWGAFQNVLINLKDLLDEDKKSMLQRTGRDAFDLTKENCESALGIIQERMSKK